MIRIWLLADEITAAIHLIASKPACCFVNFRCCHETVLCSALATAASALFSVGCETTTTAPGNQVATKTYQGKGPLKIVCTTGMVADLVKISPAIAESDAPDGAGVDPHLYKSSPGDIAKLSEADVVFYSGLHLEGEMTDLFEQLATSKPVACGGRNHPASLLDDGGLHDPHVWFNVMLWQHAAGKVEETLYKFDPKHADEYDQRHRSRGAAEELDKFCKDELAKIPADRRVLVTAHDAFRYFGKAYGIEVRGIQGVSTDSEAGVKQINELVNYGAVKDQSDLCRNQRLGR